MVFGSTFGRWIADLFLRDFTPLDRAAAQSSHLPRLMFAAEFLDLLAEIAQSSFGQLSILSFDSSPCLLPAPSQS